MRNKFFYIALNFICFLVLLTTTLNAKDEFTISEATFMGPINAPNFMGQYFTAKSEFDGRLYYHIDRKRFKKGKEIHHEESIAFIEWESLKTGKKIKQEFFAKKDYVVYPTNFYIKNEILIIIEVLSKYKMSDELLFTAYKWQGDNFGHGKFVFFKQSHKNLWNISSVTEQDKFAISFGEFSGGIEDSGSIWPKVEGFTEKSEFDRSLYYNIILKTYHTGGQYGNFHHEESIAFVEWKSLKTGNLMKQEFSPKKDYVIYPTNFYIKNNILIITAKPGKKDMKKRRLFTAYKWSGDRFHHGRFVLIKQSFKNLWNIDDVTYDTGFDLYEQGKYKDALASFNKVIDIEPKRVSAYITRGNVYKKMRMYKLAIQDYTAAIEIDPENICAYNNIASIYNIKEEYALAIKSYNRIIEINPKKADTYSHRGHVYIQLNQSSLAIKDYSKAIELDPEYIGAYNDRGVIYRKRGKYALAIKDYDKAIEIDPEFVLAYSNRGVAYERQKKYKFALKNYDKAIELNPEDPSAYNNKAWIYATVENKQYRNGPKAIAFALKSFKLRKGKGIGTLDTLGAAYVENKQYNKAIESYEKVIEKGKTWWVKRYKKILKEKGYYSGTIDGIDNQALRNALRTCIIEGNYL